MINMEKDENMMKYIVCYRFLNKNFFLENIKKQQGSGGGSCL